MMAAGAAAVPDVLEGYLLRGKLSTGRTLRVKSWKKRFVRLTRDTLSTFKSHTSPLPLDSLPLEEIVLARPVSQVCWLSERRVAW